MNHSDMRQVWARSLIILSSALFAARQKWASCVSSESFSVISVWKVDSAWQGIPNSLVIRTEWLTELYRRSQPHIYSLPLCRTESKYHDVQKTRKLTSTGSYLAVTPNRHLCEVWIKSALHVETRSFNQCECNKKKNIWYWHHEAAIRENSCFSKK